MHVVAGASAFETVCWVVVGEYTHEFFKQFLETSVTT